MGNYLLLIYKFKMLIKEQYNNEIIGKFPANMKNLNDKYVALTADNVRRMQRALKPTEPANIKWLENEIRNNPIKYI